MDSRKARGHIVDGVLQLSGTKKVQMLYLETLHRIYSKEVRYDLPINLLLRT